MLAGLAMDLTLAIASIRETARSQGLADDVIDDVADDLADEIKGDVIKT